MAKVRKYSKTLSTLKINYTPSKSMELATLNIITDLQYSQDMSKEDLFKLHVENLKLSDISAMASAIFFTTLKDTYFPKVAISNLKDNKEFVKLYKGKKMLSDSMMNRIYKAGQISPWLLSKNCTLSLRNLEALNTLLAEDIVSMPILKKMSFKNFEFDDKSTDLMKIEFLKRIQPKLPKNEKQKIDKVANEIQVLKTKMETKPKSSKGKNSDGSYKLTTEDIQRIIDTAVKCDYKVTAKRLLKQLKLV